MAAYLSSTPEQMVNENGMFWCGQRRGRTRKGAVISLSGQMAALVVVRRQEVPAGMCMHLMVVAGSMSDGLEAALRQTGW